MTEHKHVYPSNYRPGSGCPEVDQSWEILDTISPGVIPDVERFLLAGMIAGTLLRFRRQSEVLVAASHALKSYANGNSSPDLAVEVATAIDQSLAKAAAR